MDDLEEFAKLSNVELFSSVQDVRLLIFAIDEEARVAGLEVVPVDDKYKSLLDRLNRLINEAVRRGFVWRR